MAEPDVSSLWPEGWAGRRARRRPGYEPRRRSPSSPDALRRSVRLQRLPSTSSSFEQRRSPRALLIRRDRPRALWTQ